MDSFLLDLSTLAGAAGIALLCGLGIAALPWREAELGEVLSALRAVPSLLGAALPSAPPRGGRGRRAAAPAH